MAVASEKSQVGAKRSSALLQNSDNFCPGFSSCLYGEHWQIQAGLIQDIQKSAVEPYLRKYQKVSSESRYHTIRTTDQWRPIGEYIRSVWWCIPRVRGEYIHGPRNINISGEKFSLSRLIWILWCFDVRTISKVRYDLYRLPWQLSSEWIRNVQGTMF